MDVPISLGVLLALGMSLFETANHAEHAYFDSAMMLLFFLLCGRSLDHAMRRKTRAVAGNLAALKADRASLRRATSSSQVPAAALQARRPRSGAARASVCRPTAIVIGGAFRDRRKPDHRRDRRRKVAAGATVYAGSMNYSGALDPAGHRSRRQTR